MSSNLISSDDARRNLLACAAFVAENIRSADGHAEAIRAILPFYLENNEVDMAAEFANAIDDPFTRDRLLTQVAERCAAIDDDEYAFQLVEAIDDYGAQAQAREKIALVKSGRGEFEKAFEIADTLEHPDNVFAAIAVNAAEDGRNEVSDEAIAAIGFPYTKSVALQTVAGRLIESGRKKEAVGLLENALEIAREIDFTEEKLRALLDVATHFIDAERRDRAIETLDQAKQIAVALDNVHRDTFLSGISHGFFRAGSVELADATLDLVGDKTQIASTLVGFARAYREKGETAEAVETLEEAHAVLKSQAEKETRDSRAKFALAGTIASLFAVFEKEERAIELAEEISDEEQRMAALGRIAETATRQGRDEFARQAVRAISEDYARLGALIAMADEHLAADRREKAVETLAEAAALAETVPQLAPRSAACNELANRFVRLGETERARAVCRENLETISQIRDESSLAVCLAQLSALYETNDFTLTEDEERIVKEIVRKAQL